MKKLLLSAFLLSLTASALFAQDEEQPEEKKGFKKENLFTGGTVSFGYGSAYGSSNFLVGASPIFGYNITNWLDAGLTINYNYQAFRPVDVETGYPLNYRVRQTDYGGGGFIKIYPVHFLFAQAQFEHNFTRQKLLPDDGTSPGKINLETNSLLLGAGYAVRIKEYKQTFFFIALLFDVSGNAYTPYTDYKGNAVPIIKFGFQVPLFQGKSRKNVYEEPREGGGKRPRNYNRN